MLSTHFILVLFPFGHYISCDNFESQLFSIWPDVDMEMIQLPKTSFETASNLLHLLCFVDNYSMMPDDDKRSGKSIQKNRGTDTQLQKNLGLFQALEIWFHRS